MQNINFNVLLIVDTEQFECYLNLINKVVSCAVDFYYQGVIDYSKYHLIIKNEDPLSLDWLKQVKQASPTTQILLLSKKPSVEKAVAAMRAGAEDYLRVFSQSKSSMNESPRLLSRALQRSLLRIYQQRAVPVKNLLYLDDATGLYNTRYLHFKLNREIEKSKLSKQPFGLLFIDLDHFKAINDRYGHVVGTELLFQMGRHLRKFVRSQDSVFRYGGDEFLAILSPCDLPTASQVAERFRRSVESKVFGKKHGLSIQLTVSIGVALYPDHGMLPKTMIESADQAMYQAKNCSRNAVCMSGVSLIERMVHAIPGFQAGVSAPLLNSSASVEESPALHAGVLQKKQIRLEGA